MSLVEKVDEFDSKRGDEESIIFETEVVTADVGVIAMVDADKDLGWEEEDENDDDGKVDFNFNFGVGNGVIQPNVSNIDLIHPGFLGVEYFTDFTDLSREDESDLAGVDFGLVDDDVTEGAVDVVGGVVLPSLLSLWDWLDSIR